MCSLRSPTANMTCSPLLLYARQGARCHRPCQRWHKSQRCTSATSVLLLMNVYDTQFCCATDKIYAATVVMACKIASWDMSHILLPTSVLNLQLIILCLTWFTNLFLTITIVFINIQGSFLSCKKHFTSLCSPYFQHVNWNVI